MKILAVSFAGLAALTMTLPAIAADSDASAAVKREAPSKTVSLAGDYAGTWKGAGDSGGKLRLKLRSVGADWSGDASFTFESSDLTAKVKSIQVDGAKIVLVLEYTIDNQPASSTLTGELSGPKLEGTFETSGGGGTGTWTVLRV